MKKQYVIDGNTYAVKDDLKAFGCSWDTERKAWITPSIEKNGLSYMRIKGLVRACDGDIYPLHMTGQVKTISNILGRK